jgi:hypothetical protein
MKYGRVTFLSLITVLVTSCLDYGLGGYHVAFSVENKSSYDLIVRFDGWNTTGSIKPGETGTAYDGGDMVKKNTRYWAGIEFYHAIDVHDLIGSAKPGLLIKTIQNSNSVLQVTEDEEDFTAYRLVVTDDLLDFHHTISVDLDYAAFTTARTAWNDTKPDSYQYRFTDKENIVQLGRIINDTVVKVVDGVYKDQTRVDGFWLGDTNYRTIDAMYDYIAYLYERYNHADPIPDDSYVKKIDIVYDDATHIPVEINYRWFFPGQTDPVNWVAIAISEFEPK